MKVSKDGKLYVRMEMETKLSMRMKDGDGMCN